ncbi:MULTISPECIES: hypothetical protein [Caballeronia]|uniref:hypothetical protein n=1 Tax=Caballeronia TaxID=1827195 RepID=UPI001FD1076B|nr:MULTISPECIES: hypothetical protein [Caballeronia]MDR5799313.1 hypothetical protein [Caballeronia sp. LZ001]
MNTVVSQAEETAFVAAKIPIDRTQIASAALLHLVELVEVLRAPDGQRTLWQLLVDAGADIEHIVYRDVPEELLGSRDAALQFKVDTSKLKGFLVIEDNPLDRCFRLLVQSEETGFLKTVADRVFLKKLPERIAALIDDGTRRWDDAVGHAILQD